MKHVGLRASRRKPEAQEATKGVREGAQETALECGPQVRQGANGAGGFMCVAFLRDSLRTRREIALRDFH